MATTTILASTSASSILTPRDCTKKITWVTKKFEGTDLARLTPYNRSILELTKTFENPDSESRVKLIFPGLPCHRCRQLILVGTEFYSKGVGKASKPYHLVCAKEVHLV